MEQRDSRSAVSRKVASGFTLLAALVVLADPGAAAGLLLPDGCRLKARRVSARGHRRAGTRRKSGRQHGTSMSRRSRL